MKGLVGMRLSGLYATCPLTKIQIYSTSYTFVPWPALWHFVLKLRQPDAFWIWVPAPENGPLIMVKIISLALVVPSDRVLISIIQPTYIQMLRFD